MKTLSDVYTPKQLTSWRIRVDTRRKVEYTKLISHVRSLSQSNGRTFGYFHKNVMKKWDSATIEDLKLFLRVHTLEVQLGVTRSLLGEVMRIYGTYPSSTLEEKYRELFTGKALKRAVKTKRRLNILQEL